MNKNFRAYLKELESWMQGNEYNGNLEFAFRNGFLIHAVNIWSHSGASGLNLPLNIDKKAEMEEIKQLCDYADIFECPHCNHISYFDPYEIEENITHCEACDKTMHRRIKGAAK